MARIRVSASVLPQSIVVIVRNLGHISATTGVEADLAWSQKRSCVVVGPQHDGAAERPPVEDDAFLDHHIEEMLGTFSDAVRCTGVVTPRGNDSSRA